VGLIKEVAVLKEVEVITAWLEIILLLGLSCFWAGGSAITVHGCIIHTHTCIVDQHVHYCSPVPMNTNIDINILACPCIQPLIAEMCQKK